VTDPRTPVVFIHGLWLHATSWHRWTELFTTAGYGPVLAPAWPGEMPTVPEARSRPELVGDRSIDDLVDHHLTMFETLPAKPILVGHSFGGIIAEKLLDMDTAVAAIAIGVAQTPGMLPLPLSALRATLPVFRDPANLGLAVSLSAEQFRYSFGDGLPADESDALFAQWAIPAPARPLFEATANSPPCWPVELADARRGPLLRILGGRDRSGLSADTASGRQSEAGTDLIEFADRGHTLTIDDGWSQVAEACLGWLRTRALAPSEPDSVG
jgi:pimeloyl-ACP methyl ester carboxylesterase